MLGNRDSQKPKPKVKKNKEKKRHDSCEGLFPLTIHEVEWWPFPSAIQNAALFYDFALEKYAFLDQHALINGWKQLAEFQKKQNRISSRILRKILIPNHLVTIVLTYIPQPARNMMRNTNLFAWKEGELGLTRRTWATYDDFSLFVRLTFFQSFVGTPRYHQYAEKFFDTYSAGDLFYLITSLAFTGGQNLLDIVSMWRTILRKKFQIEAETLSDLEYLPDFLSWLQFPFISMPKEWQDMIQNESEIRSYRYFSADIQRDFQLATGKIPVEKEGVYMRNNMNLLDPQTPPSLACIWYRNTLLTLLDPDPLFF
jgi:hypothetical protein